MARLTLVRGETATLPVGGHTDTGQRRVLARITPAGRIPELTADHDTSLPAVQRSTVTAPAPRKSDPDLLGYLAEAVPSYPAI